MAEIRIEADWEGLGDVQDMLKRVEHVLEPPGLTEVLGLGADAFVESMKATAPVKTGALRDSIDKHVDGEGWLITGNTVYNNIQNSGGDNYGNPLMVFQIEGRTIFAPHVHIPGTHYVELGFEAGREPAVAATEEAVQAAIES